MAIFEMAYDTMACAGYRTQEIEEKLKEAQVKGATEIKHITLSNIGQEFDLHLVTGGNQASDVIPYFAHPYFYKKGEEGQTVTFVDVRNFGKWEPQQQTFRIRNYPEYQWNVYRAVLNHLFVTESAVAFRDISGLPVSVYSSLISETVARKYALDPAEQITVSIVASYFYYCLFTDDSEMEESQRNKMIGRIASITRIPAERIFTVLEGVGTIHGLENLCEVIRDKTGSIRLQEFNVGVLLSIVSGNWYGTNARENMATALEHVPTWLMICYASVVENTFKKSVVAKLVERHAKGGQGVIFTRSMESLMDTRALTEQFLQG